MKIPNSDIAVVSEDKILKYLLNENHPEGAHKATFFSKYGFEVEYWQVLAESLIAHCSENDVSATIEIEFGTKYIVEGKLNTPDRRNPVIRSIWFIGKKDEIPRFITAYPKRHD